MEFCCIYCLPRNTDCNLYPLFQIAKVVSFKWDKTATRISTKYSEFEKVYSLDLIMELPKNTHINWYTTNLIYKKQLSYTPIYAFSQVELETLKAYIKTHQKTWFI